MKKLGDSRSSFAANSLPIAQLVPRWLSAYRWPSAYSVAGLEIKRLKTD